MERPTTSAARKPDAPFGPWSCCARPPGAIVHPEQLTEAAGEWLAAEAPGTVALALRNGGSWDIDQPPDLDASDWWYRTEFSAFPEVPTQSAYLCLDGLATLAEVWLNGQQLLTTDNMFRAYRIDVRPHLRERNALVLGFRSLTEALTRKRPRPRWKTNLVTHQQLRWFRTSLLGRMPGWSPPVPVVGPWRAVRLDTEPISAAELMLRTDLEDRTGVVRLHSRINSLQPVDSATLRVGDDEASATIHAEPDGWRLAAALRVPDAPLWWPHTHGPQPLLDCFLTVRAGRSERTLSCGRLGFRHVELTAPAEPFAIRLNGVPVYCRGACWTVGDLLAPGAAGAAVDKALDLARAAGINMLRVVGTMVYESERFYQRCDELGILVWQDFMFANMDYPADDPAFAATCAAEAHYQLGRLAGHPSVTVYCGNSEVEQQAAMVGVPRELWRNRWFAEGLPALCARHHPGTVYVPSSPSGGVMPFHVGTGVAHYYGVGAYQRAPAELRQADVKFAAECLGFANLPEPQTISAITGTAAPVPHHPCWKRRVPRDVGAGWDFEDVRDYYLQWLFDVDPAQLRSFDLPRYLELSRVVGGEMMAQVFAEWRSGYSRNNGGLVWFFKDLWPAPGWGILDSRGLPKAPYYYLRRSWQSRQITLTDEGLDGFHVHIVNETAEPLAGHVELLLLREPATTVVRREVPCRLPPRARQTMLADELLGGFFDVGYAYRFGARAHDVVVATLWDEQRRVVSEAVRFLQRREPVRLPSVTVRAEAALLGAGHYEVNLQSDCFLHAVRFDVPAFSRRIITSIWSRPGPRRSSSRRWTARSDRSAVSWKP